MNIKMWLLLKLFSSPGTSRLQSDCCAGTEGRLWGSRRKDRGISSESWLKKWKVRRWKGNLSISDWGLRKKSISLEDAKPVLSWNRFGFWIDTSAGFKKTQAKKKNRKKSQEGCALEHQWKQIRTSLERLTYIRGLTDFPLIKNSWANTNKSKL